MFRRKEHVTITAQINGEWSFRIKAPTHIATGAFNDWLTIIQDNNEDSGTNENRPSRPPVGFSRTPAVDLGEAEAETYRADDDD